MSPGSSHHHVSPSSTTEVEVSKISQYSVSGGRCLQDPLSVRPLWPSLWMRMSPRSFHHHASPSSIVEEDVSRILFLLSLLVLRYGGGCLQDPLSATPLRPPLWRRMSPGSSFCYASLSSVMEEDVSRILSPSRLFALHYRHVCLQVPLSAKPLSPPLWRRMSPGSSFCYASPSSVMEEDVSRILSLSCLSVLRYGGGCLQDPLSSTPLRPPLWRRMSPGFSHRHASSSFVIDEGITRILSPPCPSVLRYRGGCLQDPLNVMPLRPPLWRRMSPWSSHRHASPSSVNKDDVSRILSLSRLSVLRYGGGGLQDPLSITPFHPRQLRRMSPGSLTVTPLCPPLWRRISPGFSHSHASSSSVMEEDVSKILSLSRLFVLRYGGGCLQDSLTVTPLRPLLLRRMSPGSSHRHASLSAGIPDCFPSYTWSHC